MFIRFTRSREITHEKFRSLTQPGGERRLVHVREINLNLEQPTKRRVKLILVIIGHV